MTSVGKWKIATYILAATTAGSLWYGGGEAEGLGGAEQAVRDASYDKRISSLSRLRIPAALAGFDEEELLRDLKSARSIQELASLCQRLGIFGTDRALDDLEALSIKRADAAGVAIRAMGGIGSDAATDRLIAIAQSGRTSYAYMATGALAKTSSRRAHAQLCEWAKGSRRGLKLAAIRALGEVPTDEALEALITVSQSPDYQVREAAVVAAGVMATTGAVDLVREVANQGNRRLRMTALRSLPRTLNVPQQEWLMDVLTADDAGCAALAAEALGRAQAHDALPLLLDAAESDQRELRQGAVRGLSSLGGENVLTALYKLFAKARSSEAYEIGRAMLDAWGDDGRGVFLAEMKKGHPARAELLGLLHDFSGDDVHALRIDIMQTGTFRERQIILNQLIGSDDPRVAKAMLEIAKTGANSERYIALNYLSRSSSVEAQSALIEIAKGHGNIANEALRILGDSRASKPEVQELLFDALYSGVPRKVPVACWALANSGSEDARTALIDALGSGNALLANSAMNALAQMAPGPEVMGALRHIATESANPQLKSSALYQLARNSDPESAAIVVEAIERGDSSAGSMITTLVERGGPDAERAIEVALASDSPQTRAALANALVHQGSLEAAPLINQLLDDSDATVKTAAVYALGNLGSKEAGDRLVQIAREGETMVRQSAISALGNSGDPRASGIIADAIGSGETSLVQTAIYSAHNAGPEVDEALLALAENVEAETYLRQQAANALINRGGVDEDKLKELQSLSSQGGGPPSPFVDF